MSSLAEATPSREDAFRAPLPRSAARPGLIVRSIVFNVLFYVTTVIYLIGGVPLVVLPARAMVGLAKFWGRTTLWYLRVICGTKVEWRGLDKIPRGALIVACKHQSTWETCALVTLFADPTYIVKRELMWLPLFGWYMRKAGMIAIDRGGGARAGAAMMARARREFRRGRQIIVFPEGTRRAAGAEPVYKPGVATLYAATGAPCLPVALNSGLVWPRHSFLRHPGTVRVEFLNVIPPGLRKAEFLARLQREIETATARLIDEGVGESGRPAV